MDIQLVSQLGVLRIHPVMPEFQHALTMTVKYCPVIEKQIQTASRGVITVKQRGKEIQFVHEPLYSLAEGFLYTHDGMLHRMMRLIKNMGMKPVYQRIPPNFPQPILEPWVVEGLYDEQKEGLIATLSHVGGAIVDAPVGSGKTRIISSLVRAYSQHRILITTNLASVVRRLYSGLREILSPYDIPVGIWQGRNRQAARVMVATAALLDRFDPDDVDVLIYDEVDEAAAAKRSSNIIRLNRAVKYGFTGTLNNRFDGKEMFLESIFGPTAYTMSDQEAEDLGRVCPMKVWAISVPEGPAVECITDPTRQERMAIWKNSRRNMLVRKLVDRIPADQQVMIFVHTEEHGTELKLNYLPEFTFFHGQLGDAEKRRHQKAFEEGTLKRVISTDALARGVDPKGLFVLIDTNWGTSEQTVIQRSGRNRRHADEKEWGVLVTFEDEWSDMIHRKAQKRMALYKRRGYEVHRHASVEDVEFVNTNSLISL